ncbi:MAG TPA: hypothetical protein VFB31_20025 [Pseudolabrys sp.]|nr:hypothetical protein [Pseudolabrys sp.]
MRAALAAALIIIGALAANLAEAGGSHLYIFLGFGNMSPGLTEFAAKMEKRGIPTTVGSYAAASDFAQDAIAQYKRGRLSSIMIIGHSLGGGAAREMAAELKEAGVPVRLVVALDPVGGPDVSSNVQRSVEIIHGDKEDHFSMIGEHEGELRGLVLGEGPIRRSQAHPHAPEPRPDNNFNFGATN